MIILDIYNTFFTDYPDVFTVNQLSEALSVSTKLTSELLKENKIRYTKIGREYRIAKVHVMEFLGIIPNEFLSNIQFFASKSSCP